MRLYSPATLVMWTHTPGKNWDSQFNISITKGINQPDPQAQGSGFGCQVFPSKCVKRSTWDGSCHGWPWISWIKSPNHSLANQCEVSSRTVQSPSLILCRTWGIRKRVRKYMTSLLAICVTGLNWSSDLWWSTIPGEWLSPWSTSIWATPYNHSPGRGPAGQNVGRSVHHTWDMAHLNRGKTRPCSYVLTYVETV